MEVLTPFYAVGCLAIAAGTGAGLAKTFGVSSVPGRFTAIDGLRGYLALSVFVHHGMVWFFWLRTGQWVAPPSNLYSHLGDASVAMFFMITGFLFFSKIMTSRTDWLRLYVSRVLRLAPLFYLAVAIMLVVVGISTGWQLNVSLGALAKSIGKWLLFFSTDVNGFTLTGRITAGVTWTLPYEWAFYAFLPLVAVVVGQRPRWPVFIVCLVGVVYFCVLNLHLELMSAFLGGAAAATLARNARFRAAAQSPLSGLLAIVACWAAFSYSGPAFDVQPLLLLTTFFVIIACGNDLFGLFAAKASRFLGEITYSVYLLHGPMLFIVFTLLIGWDKARSLSPAEHWGVILVCTPLLICVSSLTYRWVEHPCITATDKFTHLFRSRLRFFRGNVAAFTGAVTK